MAWSIAVAWLHYIGIMLLLGSVLGEHLALKQELTAAQARTIQILDMILGGSATLVLITGIIRMYTEKGVDYYLHDGAFHALVGVFVVIGLLSIYPTVVFLRWRPDTRAGRGQQLAAAQHRKLQMVIRTETALLLLAPLFATWMAHSASFSLR
jgi:putative membrane protein